MIKMKERRLGRSLPIDPGARGFWELIGSRMQARRMELGLDVACVAEKLGVSALDYCGYEAGDRQLSASMLEQIADLFGVPLTSFCGDESTAQSEETGEADSEGSPAVFRVATVEQRVESLAAAFRKLDLEGQQHLLALAGALTHSARKREHD